MGFLGVPTCTGLQLVGLCTDLCEQREVDFADLEGFAPFAASVIL